MLDKAKGDDAAFDEISALLNTRGNTHGDFTVNSRISQYMKEVARAEPGWKAMPLFQREALDMIFHKVARALAGNPAFHDHWDDIAGYAKLASRHIDDPAAS